MEEKKEEKVQEFKEKTVPEIVMETAKNYSEEGVSQLLTPLSNYIKEIMQAAFFSGAYWITHTDFNEAQMEPVEENKEEEKLN